MCTNLEGGGGGEEGGGGGEEVMHTVSVETALK